MSRAAASWADAGGVAALGAESSRFPPWFVPPIPRERLWSKVYTNVSGVILLPNSTGPSHTILDKRTYAVKL